MSIHPNNLQSAILVCSALPRVGKKARQLRPQENEKFCRVGSMKDIGEGYAKTAGAI